MAEVVDVEESSITVVFFLLCCQLKDELIKSKKKTYEKNVPNEEKRTLHATGIELRVAN